MLRPHLPSANGFFQMPTSTAPNQATNKQDPAGRGTTITLSMNGKTITETVPAGAAARFTLGGADMKTIQRYTSKHQAPVTEEVADITGSKPKKTTADAHDGLKAVCPHVHCSQCDPSWAKRVAGRPSNPITLDDEGVSFK